MALDFISLLLSKDSPVQAGLSISPYLKAIIPTGTLGADKVQGVRATAAFQNDKKLVGNGWKVQALNKSVDSILASASRLEKEIESETKYWEQVLAVSEKGWAVCRLPHEHHTLAVRYGFSEAAPVFRNQGLAALRRSEDGDIILDQNLSDSTTKAVRIRVRTNGVITGTARLPNQLEEDASIEALILQARNTIFEEELYHELDREARTLTNQGVRSISNTLFCRISPSQEILLDYISVSDADPPQLGATNIDNILAEAFSLALHLLLSYAHHQNLRRRSQPPPPISSAKRSTPPYSLLRPLLTRVHHQSSLDSVHSVLGAICSMLSAASISVTYTCTNEATAKTQATEKPSTLQVLDTLIDQLKGEAQLKIGEETTFTIRFRTMVYPLAATQFQIIASGPDTAPTPPTLTSFDEFQQYIYYATACALASIYASPTSVKEGTMNDDENDNYEVDINEKGTVGWYSTMQGPILRKSYKPLGRTKQLTFELTENELSVGWSWMRGEDDTTHREKGEGGYTWRKGGNSEALEKIMERAGTYEQ